MNLTPPSLCGISVIVFFNCCEIAGQKNRVADRKLLFLELSSFCFFFSWKEETAAAAVEQISANKRT